VKPLSITWLGHSTFVLQSPGGRRVIFDPFITGNPSAPDEAKTHVGALDLMLVTHGHSDHTGDAVALGRSTGAHVVARHESRRDAADAGALGHDGARAP
jgi:L-ascorbate metabolism protein UlaG (beta-lactamase superfamily)